MPNLYGLLNIGQSALLTHQKALDITGNNIANVNTPGYSRQRLIINQGDTVRVNNLNMSTGVAANPGIQRFYDQFLGDQLVNENESLGRWESQKAALEKIELMFEDAEGYGLSTAMNEYWNAWQDLSNNPSGVAERTTLLSTGQHLTSTFNQIHANIDNLQGDIDSHVKVLTNEINEMADKVAVLNQKIVEVEVGGHNANDYRDERDQLVFELSKKIDINSYEDGDGYLNIDVGNGKPLVQNTSTWDITTANNGGVQDVYWENKDGTTVNITPNLTGGELKGWIDARDGFLESYLTQLDDLANTIRGDVNGVHTTGRDLNGNAGLDFFTGTGATDFDVNAAIAADTDLIAAAGGGEGLPGGNSAAIAIAALQDSAPMAGGSSYNEYFSSLVGQIGSDVQSSRFNHDHQTTMVQSMEDYRQEVSGVSLDEEMINLVKYQHGYNAAAKLITTANEMIDSLMAMAG